MIWLGWFVVVAGLAVWACGAIGFLDELAEFREHAGGPECPLALGQTGTVWIRIKATRAL